MAPNVRLGEFRSVGLSVMPKGIKQKLSVYVRREPGLAQVLPKIASVRKVVVIGYVSTDPSLDKLGEAQKLATREHRDLPLSVPGTAGPLPRTKFTVASKAAPV